MYTCPHDWKPCEECEGCKYEHQPEGTPPCKPGECVRDGACYTKTEKVQWLMEQWSEEALHHLSPEEIFGPVGAKLTPEEAKQILDAVTKDFPKYMELMYK